MPPFALLFISVSIECVVKYKIFQCVKRVFENKAPGKRSSMSFLHRSLFLFLVSMSVFFGDLLVAAGDDESATATWRDLVYMNMLQGQNLQYSQKSGSGDVSVVQTCRLENNDLLLLASVIEENNFTDIVLLTKHLQGLMNPSKSSGTESLPASPATFEGKHILYQSALTQLYEYKLMPKLHEKKSIENLKEWINAKIKTNFERIQRAQSSDQKVADHSLVGKAAVYGLAGKSAPMYLFNDMKAGTSVLGAVGAGLTYRTMSVVGDEFEKMIRQEGAPLLDSVVGGPLRKTKNKLMGFWYWLFHGGARPYTIDQVIHWKNEVLEVILKGLSDYASKAQSSQSDGFGVRARAHQFDDFSDEEQPAEEAKVVAQPVDITWITFVDGLARDLDRLTMRMEFSKRFYSPMDEEDELMMNVDGRLDLLDTVTRIQEVLQFIKMHLLVPTRTLKDLAAGDLKFLLPRIQNEIAARFALFENMVRQYHGISGVTLQQKEASSLKKESSSRSGYPSFD